MQTGGDQTCDMRHIDEQVCADLVCDLSELFKINGTRISGGAGNDHLRLLLLRHVADCVIVDVAVVVYAVGNNVVEQTGLVDRRAVGQVAAVVQAHAHNGVARLAERLVDRHVGLRARMRLNVCELCTEYLADAADRQTLHLIDALAAAVIALARIALCVLVGQNRAHRRHDCLAYDILGCDQLNIALLALIFCLDHIAQFRVICLYKIHCLAYHVSSSICKGNIIITIKPQFPRSFHSERVSKLQGSQKTFCECCLICIFFTAFFRTTDRCPRAGSPCSAAHGRCSAPGRTARGGGRSPRTPRAERVRAAPFPP